MRIAVFASGRGSNFSALIQARNAGKIPCAEFAALVSDRADAPALGIARSSGIEAIHVSPKCFPDKAAYENAILANLRDLYVDAICLAGYMRLVGPVLLDAFPSRILNIHPSLLPAFPGAHAHRDALQYGAKISGCTVHFVDEGMDTGPVILQRCVPVLDNDTETTLASRILVEEHQAYPEALDLFTRNLLRIEGRRVIRTQ